MNRDRMERDSEFVRHIACEACGSSDANSEYTDGHTHCFACLATVSGGEEGALRGPAIMPGGSNEAWEAIAPIFRAIAAKAEMSAQDILQHFYQAIGGSAWQRFEECDSAATVALSQKTGTMRYFENLHSGGNRADMEISALDIKQANGTGPIQNWHQDAAGDIQVSPPDDPVSIDDREGLHTAC